MLDIPEETTQFGCRAYRYLAGTEPGVSSVLASIQRIGKYYMGYLGREVTNSHTTVNPAGHIINLAAISINEAIVA